MSCPALVKYFIANVAGPSLIGVVLGLIRRAYRNGLRGLLPYHHLLLHLTLNGAANTILVGNTHSEVSKEFGERMLKYSDISPL